MRRTWYAVNLTNNGGAEIVIYDEIGFFGVTAKDFLNDLKALGDVSEITIHINSPGGSVFEGFAIHNALKRHKAHITVYIDGLAASIASVVAMAGDEVIMPENAMMMIHDPSGLVLGTAEDMEKLANALRKMTAGIVSAYRAKTGLADAEIEGMMADETWFTAAEAVEKGFADEVEEPVQAAALFDLDNFKNPPAAYAGVVAAPSGGKAAGDGPGQSSTSNVRRPAMADKENKPEAEEQPVDETTETPEAAEANKTTAAPEGEGGEGAGNEAAAGDPAKAERARILAIQGAAPPGHEKLVAKLIDEGTPAGDAALALLHAEKETGARKLAEIKGDLGATDGIDTAATTEATGKGGGAALPHPGDTDAFAAACRKQWDASADIQDEFGGRFNEFLATMTVDENNKRARA